MHVLATAGHVDHGKSTLVHALTGIDPDRLAEEKKRGLTIDLGFAWTTLPTGRPLTFVDVPGHVRFIKNMLAGAGAVDGCLFVVAATEGWKPQSEEHLRILDLLGVAGGVVALTKASLVDGRLEEVTDDVRRRLAGTLLADAEIIPTDAPSGAGMSDLVDALDRLLGATPVAADRGRPRLWIDRCFAAAGSGTVVTGTLTGGSLHVQGELHIVPGPAPSRRAMPVRVRTIQTHGTPRQEVGPGHRVALGLLGAGHDRLERARVTRGQAVVRLSQWAPASTLDATLAVLEASPAPVGRRGAYHAYIGSGEHAVRVRVLGSESLDPGDRGLVRLHLPVPLPLLPGDRYVLRDAGRGATLGGGEILDVEPRRSASRARPDRSVDRVVAERGWVTVDQLERLTGERRRATLGRWVVDPATLRAAQERITGVIDAAGPLGLDVAGLEEHDRLVVAGLQGDRIVAVHGGRVRRPDQGPDVAGSAFLAALEASPFAPPEATAFGADRAELRELVRSGLVLERDGRHFAVSAVHRGSRIVRDLLAASPEGVTMSAIRAALGTTRKHALPFVSLLDSEGITRRRGDLRVGGPRLLITAGSEGAVDKTASVRTGGDHDS